ncbi:MAG: hypothetical protein JRI22_23785 [Deltaproteobacteria bacterium]|nr:hypothetical protein [Deltaproteobacteria bacterium]
MPGTSWTAVLTGSPRGLAGASRPGPPSPRQESLTYPNPLVCWGVACKPGYAAAEARLLAGGRRTLLPALQRRHRRRR